MHKNKHLKKCFHKWCVLIKAIGLVNQNTAKGTSKGIKKALKNPLSIYSSIRNQMDFLFV